MAKTMTNKERNAYEELLHLFNKMYELNRPDVPAYLIGYMQSVADNNARNEAYGHK